MQRFSQWVVNRLCLVILDVSAWSLLIETPHQIWATFADDRRYNVGLHTEPQSRAA